MQKYFALIALGFGVVAVSWLNIDIKQVAAQTSTPTAVFDPQGRLKLPTDYRKWVFVGAPLTPNGLNGGSAGFPEYHNVYIQEKDVDAYLKNKVFPEGTVIIKELTRVLNPTFPDGSTTEPSGRGYFNGVFNGIDATVKDSKKFADSGGWGYAQFDYDVGSEAFKPADGSSSPPQEHDAKCGFACHTIVANKDYVFTAYPQR